MVTDGRRSLRLAVVVLVAATACAGSSRSLADYREKAANTAEAMTSSLETARIAIEASLRGKTLSRYLSLVLSESEVDARSIAESFERVQPPGGAETGELRAGLTTLLTECTSILADLRIAAYRGDQGSLRGMLGGLGRLRERLAPFMERVPT